MIHRFKENPLIEPDPQIPWMTENAFNPGVVRDDRGLFHMLIRGGINRRHQGCSDLGYASSKDGIHWKAFPSVALSHKDYGAAAEMGIEDPRIVRWNDSFYVFATASHRHYGRLGIWQTDDFKNFSFLGTPFNWEDKNGCIIPQMIGNKIYLIHRMFPNMWIAETTNRCLDGEWTSNRILLRAEDVVMDGRVPFKIGLAAPPVQWDDDWLVLFHAVFEPIEYRIGFMILDGTNPHNIKFRYGQSILRPELSCEKYGAVPCVCFLTAMVDMGDRYYLYWGGADTVICGGELHKSDILDACK